MRTLTTLALCLAQLAALVAWKFYGIEAAGNLLLFWVWFFAIVGIMAFFLPAQSPAAPKSRVRRFFSTFTCGVLLVALAWYGHFVSAAFFVLGWLGLCMFGSRFDDDGLPREKGPA